MNSKIKWLNVTGAPRSGTTALGEELNKSENIAILHEHKPHRFFYHLNGLFENEAFHKKSRGFDLYSSSIIKSNIDHINILRGIFSTVFSKDPLVIGSKLPGFHTQPDTKYPDFLDVLELNIIRNPISVINSFLLKDDNTLPSDNVEECFCQWLNAYNHTISRSKEKNFMVVIYERFGLGENELISRKIADFLSITCDFDFADYLPSKTIPAPRFLNYPEGQNLYNFISKNFDLSKWVIDIEDKLNSNSFIGFPHDMNTCMDLSNKSTPHKFAQVGFYHPTSEGVWTKGKHGLICFSPLHKLPRCFSIILDVPWALNFDGKGTEISLRLGDHCIGKRSLIFENSKGNDKNRKVVFNVRGFVQQKSSVELLIKITNPQNPAYLGLSDDDRELGIMINSIKFNI